MPEGMISLNALIEGMLKKGGENTAIRFNEKGVEKSLSFTELYEKIQILAGWMAENFQSGTGIGILGDNCAEWLIVFFAALLSGNTAVLMDKTARGEAVRIETELSGVSVFFIGKGYRSILGDTVDGAEIYSLENIETLPGDKKSVLETDDGKPALVFFSSGTTGRQKAVMIRRRQLGNRIMLNRDAWEYPEENLMMLPLYHSYGQDVATGTLFQGKCLYLSKSQKYFLRDIKEKKPVMLSLVPSQAEMLLDYMEKEGEKLPLSHVMLASAKVEEPLKLRMKNHDLRHIALYGSSESGTISVGEEEKMASGFAGKILRGVEIRINDADSVGVGEIFARSQGVFSNYLKDEEKTTEIICDGWIRTGDIGRLDDDGNLFITGRAKNVIILPNGEKISPELLEESLLNIPGVLECMVHEKNGRLEAELYAEKTGREGMEEGIRKINSGLSLYQQINEVIFRNEPFEKTALGKKKR